MAAAFRGDVSVAAGLVLTAKSGGLARFCCLPLAVCRLLDVHLPMVPAQSAPSDFSWPMMAAIELFGLFFRRCVSALHALALARAQPSLAVV